MQQRRTKRIMKERKIVAQLDESLGISVDWKDSEDSLTAKITGSKETPFEGGVFQLRVTLPDRYPFVPPDAKFLTKIYHPNVDGAGRICLDNLKSKPKGCWAPSMNVAVILKTIQVLMGTPNPEDPLCPEIAKLYKNNVKEYERKAREYTDRFA